jgi:lauroyl/myristoyl acyltransferase
VAEREDPAPWGARQLRKGIRNLGRLANGVSRIHPAAGLALAGSTGAHLGTRAGSRRCPRAGLLRWLFPEIDAASVERVRREIAALEFRNRTLHLLLERRGIGVLTPLLEIDADPLIELVEARTPVVVVSWHMGPFWASSAALEKLGIPALFAVHSARPGRGAGAIRYFDLAEGLTARFLKQAVAQLDAGRPVGMAIDFPLGALTPIPFFDRLFPVPHGVAAVARLSGARVLPVTRRWIGNSSRAEVTFHSPFPEPSARHSDKEAYERELLERVIAWFEAHLRSDPGSMRLAMLDALAHTPLAPARRGTA